MHKTMKWVGVPLLASVIGLSAIPPSHASASFSYTENAKPNTAVQLKMAQDATTRYTTTPTIENFITLVRQYMPMRITDDAQQMRHKSMLAKISQHANHGNELSSELIIAMTYVQDAVASGTLTTSTLNAAYKQIAAMAFNIRAQVSTASADISFYEHLVSSLNELQTAAMTLPPKRAWQSEYPMAYQMLLSMLDEGRQSGDAGLVSVVHTLYNEGFALLDKASAAPDSQFEKAIQNVEAGKEPFPEKEVVVPPTGGKPSASTDVQVEIEAGDLSLHTPSLSAPTAIKLGKTDNAVYKSSASFAQPFTLSDATGKQAGYTLTVKASPLTQGLTQMPPGSITLQPLAGNNIIPMSGNYAPRPSPSTSTTTAIDTGSAVTVLTANKGEGMGAFSVDYVNDAIGLAIDPHRLNMATKQQTFSSQITWSLVQAP